VLFRSVERSEAVVKWPLISFPKTQLLACLLTHYSFGGEGLLSLISELGTETRQA